MIQPSFSFTYDGVPFSQLDVKIETKAGETEYLLPDGVKLVCRREEYAEYGVSRWVNYWENPTGHDSCRIENLFDCDITLPFDADPPITARNRQSTWEPETLQVYVTQGANVKDDDNFADPRRLWAGDSFHAKPEEKGYSCFGIAPFFDVNRGDKGVLMAIGWSGQWHALFERGENDLRMCSGIENAAFKIRPGEKFRTSSVVLLSYENGQDAAHNAWRRYIREKVSPIGKQQRDPLCPFSAIFWGGVPSDEMISRWSKIFEHQLPFDYCWIDAGWYEPLKSETCAEQLREWPAVGTWEVSKKYHPKAYRDLIDYLAEHQVKMQIWFEPERIVRSVKEWTSFLPAPDPNADSVLVAMNEDKAADDVIELISDRIEKLSLSCYRQDYNIAPLPFWLKNDEPDRGGMTEILYINNFYRFWDTLLERFPHLIIDNCAGGGHRIDIETLGRAVPLWRSDYQCTWDCCPEANQNQNMGAAWWYPFSGIGYGPTLGDTYSFRSAYTSGMTVRTWEHVDAEWAVGGMNEPLDWAKQYFDEYVRVRPFFSKDYYPIIPANRSNLTWAASQFDDPENGEGIILAFRRARCPHDTAKVYLGGVQEEKNYCFKNRESGEEWTVDGKTLAKEGLVLKIQNARESQLLEYSVK